MRSMGMILAAVVFVGLASDGQAGCVCRQSAPEVWDAAPCCAPPGYTLVPGCCEPRRRCCDNAWAGYCEHRARVEAFWSKVGTPRPKRPRRCRLICRPATVVASPPECSAPAPRPEPPKAPTPAPSTARVKRLPRLT